MAYSIQQTVYMGGSKVIFIFKYIFNCKNVWLIVKYCNNVSTILVKSTLLNVIVAKAPLSHHNCWREAHYYTLSYLCCRITREYKDIMQINKD
jgi:hypothetical protein